ncbi:flagellin N-terminal helical domain-containing protein [Methylobacterium sp. ID0610]|uniref:flagellin N-terminal helical domain-containing protein n=1 Tax=Methylobacterium carpenticola TaxID=3344827 RepID=UPI0036A9DA0B
MSSITLSAATRQNLLSLQDTANLLATTQERLATGKKVNSALDNPTNYFTADGLSSRSAGLSALLDGVSNGIQIIQAANTGITKLRSLTDQLKSVAQQALAASNAFTAKASVASTALTGATASNLLSVGPTAASADRAIGASTGVTQQTTTGTVDLSDTTNIDAALFASGNTATLTIDDVKITLNKGVDDVSQDVLVKSINTQLKSNGSAVTVEASGANIVAKGTADGGAFTIGTDTGTTNLFGASPNEVAGVLVPTSTSLATGLGFHVGDNFTVNGKTITVARNDTMISLAQKVGVATGGAVTAAYDANTRKFTFTAADPSTTIAVGDGGTPTSKVKNLGFDTQFFEAGRGAITGTTYNASRLDGQTITVQVGGGTAVSLTFGTALGQIATLTQLNAALAPANAQASLDATTGQIKVTTTNEAGAESLTLLTVGATNPFNTATANATIGGDGLTSRNGLVTTYNNLLTQIDQLAADSGYNGVNLLAGDTLRINFNEKSTSSLSVSGNDVSAASLGLSTIGQNDFLETNAINKVLTTINSAVSNLKNLASSLGANLAVVQNRQDFTKQIINVLDTGAANLTNADMNEEAANSQALSTRNSLGISALSLANQAQQGVLQLLR